ncbi:MAG TPA: hypothetical protein VHN20_17050 [Beijerinckiaceae bacterium]|nr:hypothetical protein [Beijerinckiaceae bacterium]
MLPTIVLVVVVGFLCGLLLLHWLALAFVCGMASVAYALVSPWDWLLLAKWFRLLTAFQMAYLAGLVIQVLAGDARVRKQGGHPAGAGLERGWRGRLVWRISRRRRARREPAARA